MRGVYFLSRERLVHADSDERGEAIKKKKVRDGEGSYFLVPVWKNTFHYHRD